MQVLLDIWYVLAVLGLFATLAFLRALACHLQHSIEQHNTKREALRIRRDYEADLERRRQAYLAGDGVIEV